MKKGPLLLLYFIVFLALISVFRLLSATPSEEKKYSEFKALLAGKQVKDLVITAEQIRGVIVKEGTKESPSSRSASRTRPHQGHKCSGRFIRGRITDNWLRDLLLVWILPIVVLVLI
jgi:hypothetical protein